MTVTAPTSHVFAACLRQIDELARTHPEAAGRFAMELSAWLDAVQHEADEHVERVIDEP